MRPITVLHAVLRLRHKILANRLQRAISAHPTLLHNANRGFIWGGSTQQPIDSLLDILEEHKLSASNRASPLFLAFYDQKRAFDSLQPYSIKASLERLCLPAEFVEYMMNYVQQPRSAVRTAFGPSSFRTLFSGVRQGDPLSSLIYIFYMDALHWGYENHAA
jgi:hypothetical protein